jgi:hypothetical protein
MTGVSETVAGRPDDVALDRDEGRASRFTPRDRTLLVVAGLLAFFALPLRGLLRYQGPPMEEGFMLVFPELVLHGFVPNKDFLHLYGPGSLWVLAGVFKVFGTSLPAERIVALLQQIGVVLGVAALARYWGRSLAFLCGLVSLFIILPPIGLTALAWVGAVALGLFGLVVGLDARHVGDSTSGRRRAVVAGVLFGLALLFRLDLVIAVGLGALVLLWGARWMRRWLAIGTAIGLVPYVAQVVMAGPYRAFRGMILDPVVYLRGGRRLPLPPSWGHFDGFLNKSEYLRAPSWPLPALKSPSEITVWFFFLLASAFFVLGVGLWRVRADRTSFRARVLLAGGAFGVGLLPQAVQRADSTHLAWVSCVPIALLPVAIAELLRVRSRTAGWRVGTRNLIAGGSVLLALVVLIPHFTLRTYVDLSKQTFGIDRFGNDINFRGRTFYTGSAPVARAVNEMLPEVERITRPGQKVFVGPTDLRKTPYSDAFIYFLLMPRLTPSTYYIEMDPGVANEKGSRLASDLRKANVAILSAVWKDWDEPNDSRTFGSDVPNQVLRRDFCHVASYGNGLYELYRRCRSS